MEWIIYKHTNKINGKCYIGQTKQSAKVRWANGLGYNPYNSPKNCVFWNAIKKHGWGNFTHEILEDNISSQKEANEREIYWIDFYRSYVGYPDSNGYNMTLGGDSHDHQGLEVNQISKDGRIIATFASIVMASKNTGIGKSQIGRCCRGEKVTGGNYYWCYAKNYSNDWAPKKNLLYSPVYQLDPDFKKIIGVFESIQDAAKVTNINASGITQCCQRKTSKAGDYFWCYQFDYCDDWEPAKEERKKRVYCVDLEKVYPNAIVAARENNCNYQHILHCCNHLDGFNSVGGHYWCYYRDRDKFVKREDKDVSPVICVNTGEKFKSIVEAARLKNASASSISFCCRGLRKTANGLTWCYEKDYTNNMKVNRTKERKIVCIETGKTFNSITEAVKSLNIARGSLSNCLAGRNKTAGGYHWKYL